MYVTILLSCCCFTVIISYSYFSATCLSFLSLSSPPSCTAPRYIAAPRSVCQFLNSWHYSRPRRCIVQAVFGFRFHTSPSTEGNKRHNPNIIYTSRKGKTRLAREKNFFEKWKFFFQHLDIYPIYLTVDQIEVNHSDEHASIRQTCSVAGLGSLQFLAGNATNWSPALDMHAISRCCTPTPHETEHWTKISIGESRRRNNVQLKNYIYYIY